MASSLDYAALSAIVYNKKQMGASPIFSLLVLHLLHRKKFFEGYHSVCFRLDLQGGFRNGAEDRKSLPACV